MMSVERMVWLNTSATASMPTPKHISPALAFTASRRVVWLWFLGVTKNIDLPKVDFIEARRLVNSIDPYSRMVWNRYHAKRVSLIFRE